MYFNLILFCEMLEHSTAEVSWYDFFFFFGLNPLFTIESVPNVTFFCCQLWACFCTPWKSDISINILQVVFFAAHQTACNSLALIFSLSGWLQSSFEESPQMRSLMFIVLEWSCGSLWRCNSLGMDLVQPRCDNWAYYGYISFYPLSYFILLILPIYLCSHIINVYLCQTSDWY